MADATSTTKTITLGAEHDDDLRDVLRDVLHQLGATGGPSSWGVGGSQELETVEVIIDGRPLTIEAETYVGLSITADEPLASLVASRVAHERAVRGI